MSMAASTTWAPAIAGKSPDWVLAALSGELLDLRQIPLCFSRGSACGAASRSKRRCGVHHPQWAPPDLCMSRPLPSRTTRYKSRGVTWHQTGRFTSPQFRGYWSSFLLAASPAAKPESARASRSLLPFPNTDILKVGNYCRAGNTRKRGYRRDGHFRIVLQDFRKADLMHPLGAHVMVGDETT